MATEVELFNAAVVSALPHGMIVAHAGKTVPDGFLLCNGAAVSRKTYAKLFEAIGELWGAGDGSTTFNLPDSDGRVLQGATDASKVGKYLEAGLPNITGNVSTDGEYGADIFKISSINGAFVNGATVMGWSTTATQKGVTTNTSWLRLNASKSNGIYSKSNTVQSAAIQILIIIKV